MPFYHQVLCDGIDDIQDPIDITCAVVHFLTCTWVCMGLCGSTCSECLPVVTCDFEPAEHVPRTSTSAQTCAVVFGRVPCVPRSREHEKRPAAGREKNADEQKKTHVYIVTGFPFGVCDVKSRG